jgi:hypothetical protein
MGTAAEVKKSNLPVETIEIEPVATSRNREASK